MIETVTPGPADEFGLDTTVRFARQERLIQPRRTDNLRQWFRVESLDPVSDHRSHANHPNGPPHRRLRPASPHVLRHNAGTAMIMAGEDIAVVADIRGHSVEVARRRTLPSDADKQRAIGRVPVDE